MADRIEFKKSIADAQKELAQNCGYEETIIWDLLTENEGNRLKDKIKQLIPNQKTGQETIIKLRSTIFENVWKQKKYSNNNSYTSIFYVMVTSNMNLETASSSTNYSCHPVIRCKKCTTEEFDTRNCCMVYVDECGRVYENWKSYITENVLPAGTMITPRRGIYNFDKNGDVVLDVFCTPRGDPGAQLLEMAQTGSAVVGLGAGFVPLAAIVLPVAAPVMAVATAVGLGVGGFTAINSFFNLKDRKKHDQSISPTDKVALANYLGLVGGAVGIAAAGATRAMTSMVSAGKATAKIEVLVNGLNISSILLSGGGLANGVFDLIFKFRDGDEISREEFLLMSASLVLFTHSIYNFQLASQIADSARNNTIKSYREGLSNRQRKMFDKMSKETLRIQGIKKGRMDIVRGVNEIPDKQYLNDLFKINKQLNQQKVRPSFGASGKNIMLNNEMPVNTGELRASVQHQRGPNVLEQISKPIPSNHGSDSYIRKTPVEIKQFFDNGNVGSSIEANLDDWKTAIKELGLCLSNGAKIFFKEFGSTFLNNISNISQFNDVIKIIFERFERPVAELLIQIAQTFLNQCKDAIEREIKSSISTETVLYRIIEFVLNKYTTFTLHYLITKTEEIIQGLKNKFSTYNPTDYNGMRESCLHCRGYRIISSV